MSEETQVLTAGWPVAATLRPFAPVMRSSLSDLHRKLGAELAIQDGWELAQRYTDTGKERDAIRDGLGIADISARGKIDVRGAVDSSLRLITQMRGAALAKISHSWALVLTPPGGLEAALQLMEKAADRATMVTDATSVYAGIALLGPRVPDLLLRLCAFDPSELKPGYSVATQLLRMPAVLLRRDLPITAVEAFVPSEFARYAWESMFAVARPLAPQPVGWEALGAEGWR